MRLTLGKALIILALIPATLASAFGFLQWTVFRRDREGDEDGLEHFFGLLAPEMAPHWRRIRTAPFSKAAWKNILTEWTCYHVEGPGDAEVPGKVLSFCIWVALIVGSIGWAV